VSGTGRRALVLGGGGVAGIAWQTGLVAAFADSGVDVSGADLILGTSAGATVAAGAGAGGVCAPVPDAVALAAGGAATAGAGAGVCAPSGTRPKNRGVRRRVKQWNVMGGHGLARFIRKSRINPGRMSAQGRDWSIGMGWGVFTGHGRRGGMPTAGGVRRLFTVPR